MPAPFPHALCLCLRAGPCTPAGCGAQGQSQTVPTEPVTCRSSRTLQYSEPRSTWLYPSQNHQPEISSFASESPRAEACDGFKGLYETKTSCCIFMLRITFLNAGKAAALGLCLQEPAGRPGRTLSVLPQDCHKQEEVPWGQTPGDLTVSQLLPTLLPPTSSSKMHPPHPAHHHTRSPTFLLGCCGLLPALSSSLCSSSEALPWERACGESQMHLSP